jgi:hypothetical protein
VLHVAYAGHTPVRQQLLSRQDHGEHVQHLLLLLVLMLLLQALRSVDPDSFRQLFSRRDVLVSGPGLTTVMPFNPSKLYTNT